MLIRNCIKMGMLVSVRIVDKKAAIDDITRVFNYFDDIDRRFSPFKTGSEVTRINRGQVYPVDYSQDMKEILRLCEQTKKITHGYFDAYAKTSFDPSGLVKGWAVRNAAGILTDRGLQNFCVEAGGDIQASGRNPRGDIWRVGIRNPFNPGQIIKTVGISGSGIATSGVYFRGQHIYDPYSPDAEIKGIISLTVIAPDIFEADRFATAAFAMGEKGIGFIAGLPGFAGYMINPQGRAVFTPGFNRYVI